MAVSISSIFDREADFGGDVQDASFGGHVAGCGCPACRNLSNQSQEDGGNRKNSDTSFTYEDSYRAIISKSIVYASDSGLSQRPIVMTYSFLSAVYKPESNQDADAFVAGLTEEQKNIIRDVLKMYSEVANITFLETKNAVGDINFGQYSAEEGVAGYAYYPDDMAYYDGGKFRVDTGFQWTERGLVAFDWKYFLSNMNEFKHVALHEIGHALGLEHPHDGSIRLSSEDDTGTKTFMSYKNPWIDDFGPYDVQALQTLYGTPDTPNPINWTFDAVEEILTQWGTSKGEYLRGTRTDDRIHTGGGADAVVTFDGDDIIYADSANIEVNAGEGLDFVHIAKDSSHLESQARYSATSATVTVDGESARLLNLERVEFTDKTLAFDINGTAGDAYRLYNAVLDRAPDLGGLGYWIRLLDEGIVTLKQMAYFTLQSPEFTARNGDIFAMSDEDFLNLLYGNILDRTPDQSGFQYWMDVLGDDVAREYVVGFFSDSPENRNAVDGEIENGLWYI